jgi:hypothetical protein
MTKSGQRQYDEADGNNKTSKLNEAVVLTVTIFGTPEPLESIVKRQ